MFRKKIILAVFLAFFTVNTVFSQAVAIDTALLNAAKEISGSVPQGTRIAVLNISSEYQTLSDYIINELIVNLVNTRHFQVVPRNTIELELTNREFDFQMTGYVSDESQKRLGQFLGAGTIISGSVTIDSTNTYRLIVNAIHLENFTYQASYRTSIRNDMQMSTLRGVSYEYKDYSLGQRLGIGALNMFFGLGSIVNGHPIGLVVTIAEIAGIGLFITPFFLPNTAERPEGDYTDREYDQYKSQLTRQTNTEVIMFVAGSALFGAGIIIGYIIPFFHHKPNTGISQNNFPFNLELVSSNNQGINGVRLLYNMKF